MGSWIVFAIQITLSLITLAIAVLSFVWLRSSAREGRETKRLVETLSALFRGMHGAPLEVMRPGGVPHDDAQIPPPAETRPPLAVKLGAEVVELDAETVARIDALQEDVNVGLVDGRLLQLLIDAGLEKAERGDRISGEVQREPAEDDEDEPTQDTPTDEVPPTTPKKPRPH